MFDCIRRNKEVALQNGESYEDTQPPKGHNHTFHLRCLKRFLETEYEREKNKKKFDTEEMFRLFRCPICNPNSHNFLLEESSGVQKKRTEMGEVESR